ncbi:MAG: hypothetical protein PF569_00675 [Candidatus Woesearchaeota archaeon]|jgi:CDP-diglyceride synthetase|nr:hypothetical protein [Candidatus Woesearchaeota archaeon]
MINKAFEHGFGEFNPTIFAIETFTMLIVIFSCFLIFYKTKEIYQLTEHKGIKYFRKGFLFFGFGFTIKLLTNLLRPEIINWEVIDRRVAFGIFVLFQLISIFYLLSSLYSKKIKEYYIYLITSIIFLLSLFLQTPKLMGLYGFTLITILGITSYIRFKKSKKKLLSQIYIIYILLFGFWIFMMISQTIGRLLDIQRVYGSIFIAIFFMYILYRVLKRLKV